jgi:serine/threonine protein kinase
MTDEVIELLVCWEEGQEQGRDISPEVLCAGRPELVDELHRRIAQLKALGRQSDTVDGTPVPPVPEGYRLIRRLGGGSYGDVWLAEDLDFEPGSRFVALKTIRPRLKGPEHEALLAALRREAQHLIALRHPNVVQLYGWERAGDAQFLVLQYVPGGSLEQRLKERGLLGWHDAARYVADVGEGLLEVHARGVLHCDIKPANILWDAEKDEALLTDFSIAVHLADPGSRLGTAPYMAPEAHRGRIEPASDVYNLAATLFHLVSSCKPFPGPGVDDYLQQIAQGLPDPDPRCAGLPAPLERVIRDGLAADPGRRPPLRAFVDALRGALNQLLADTLTVIPSPGGPPGIAPVKLQLRVCREAGAGRYEVVAATDPPPDRLTRDMRRVPASPGQVRLHTGERVRVEVLADHPGYIVVFNIGPAGQLNLLYPEGPSSLAPARIEANRPLQILDVELTPPAGRERLFAVWSRDPLRYEQLTGLSEPGGASRPYRATRDMRRVQESVDRQPPGSRHVAIVEVDHVP